MEKNRKRILEEEREVSKAEAFLDEHRDTGILQFGNVCGILTMYSYAPMARGETRRI